MRKTILLPLSSTKARLEDFKRNFSLETTADIHNSINKWINSWSLACRPRLKDKIASSEDWLARLTEYSKPSFFSHLGIKNLVEQT